MSDLKLLALDTEDLEVISTHVQDAVVRVADMGYARGDNYYLDQVDIRYTFPGLSEDVTRLTAGTPPQRRTP